MAEAQHLLKEFEQDITILTNDQHLTVSVKLVCQERFSYFIPRIESMHMFMNLI